MVTVNPFPDEVAAAHVSRWLHVLGSRSLDHLRAEISLGLQAQYASESDLPLLDCIARASALMPLEYLRGHSMLGLERVAICTEEVLPAISNNTGTYQGEAFLRLPRKEVFLCVRCVNRDLTNNSTSWYRREHQIPGAEWCLEHTEALRSVSTDQAFLQAPHDLLDQECLGKALVTAEISKTGFISRFLEISKHLLQEAVPVDCEQLHLLLGDRADMLGIFGTPGKGRKLLSDLILENADERWLLQHFTQFIHKMPGKKFGQVDKILSQTNSPAEGGYYALSFAALFPSATDAIELLGKVRCESVG